MKKKIVFLDRDGTLIEDCHYLADPQLVKYLPTTFEALQLLKQHGFEFIMVTNQSGIERGLISWKNVEDIHLKMKQDLAHRGLGFLDILICPSAPPTTDPRRKPEPGMLLEAMASHPVDPKKSWMVGDKWSDVEAGRRAQLKSLFLDSGKEEPPNGFPVFKQLMEVSLFILREDGISI